MKPCTCAWGAGGIGSEISRAHSVKNVNDARPHRSIHIKIYEPTSDPLISVVRAWTTRLQRGGRAAAAVMPALLGLAQPFLTTGSSTTRHMSEYTD